MTRIEIYVCCHKRFYVPKQPLLKPMQVGAAIAKNHFSDWLHDDDGDSISEKNRSYCELTAQYWAWKNSGADYVGFFHYRRFLYPDTSAKRPYFIKKEPSQETLDKLGFSALEGLIKHYDIIAPLSEDMHISVREHYKKAPHHRAEDLELAESIVTELYPEYADPMNTYLSQTKCYFGNIFIMRREIFNDYCRWLFSILEEFDRRANWENRTPQELRVDGYLAERLFGVYLTKHGNKHEILTLPRVHFERDTVKRIRSKAINFLLPPGSVGRARIKSIMR